MTNWKAVPTNPQVPESSWAVARTIPHFETRARAELERLGFVTYLPLCLRVFWARGRLRRHVSALFPKYAFVRLDPGVHWPRVFEADHVVGIIRDGNSGPALVAESVIDELRSRETDGFIRLTETPKRPRFHRGQPVRIRQRQFTGLAGMFDRHDGGERVKVLLNILGRQTAVMMRVDMLEPDAPATIEHKRAGRRRRTRRQRQRRHGERLVEQRFRIQKLDCCRQPGRV